MDRVTAINRVWLLAALPPVVTALAWITIMTMAGITGTHPIWTLTPRNPAEAAAFRDGGAVVRFVEQGSDINRPGPVSRGTGSQSVFLTPLEAAAAARDSEMVQLLFDLGASPDASVWQRSFCISDASSVREVLAAHRPPDTAEICAQQ